MAQDIAPRNQDFRPPYGNRGNAGRLWAWVLFAIVVAFIVWVFASGFGSPNPSHARPRSGDSQGYQSTNASRITDAAAIQNAPDAGELVGRDVEFRNAKIQGVEAHGGFWIGGPAGKGVFVLRKNSLSPNQTEGGAVKQSNHANPNVSIGQTVDVTGKVEKLPDTETVHLKWGLDPGVASQLESEKVYVSADSVSVAPR